MSEVDSIGELEAAIGGVDTQEPVEATPEVETFEYFNGEEANKLPVTAEFSVKHNGEVTKVPLDKLVNGYRQATHAEGKFAEAKTLREQAELQAKEVGDYKTLQETLKPFQELQDWSLGLEKSNPTGYAHLMETIDRLKNGTLTNEGTPEADMFNSMNSVVNSQNEKIASLEEKLGKYEEFQQELQTKEDVEFVNQEAEEIKKSFPEINLDEVGEDGIKLETKVINWGADKGFQNFTDAFHAHFRDKIADILVQRGKNEALGKIKGDSKKGVIARSSTPLLDGHSTTDNETQASSLALLDEALAQM